MRRILIAVLIAFAAVALIAAPADAQKAKAKKEFDKGVAAMDAHDYKTALEHFQTAYDAAPHWMVLAHIGNCHAKLNDPVNSIKAYEQFLKDGGEDIDPEQRAAARENLEEQRKKVGSLQLLVKPKESEVTIDGEKLGNPPFDEILLRAGPHHILVVRNDEEVEQDFQIEAGKEKIMKIYPKEDAGAVAVVAPPTPEPEPAPAPAPKEPKAGPSLVETEAAPYMEPEPSAESGPLPPPTPAEGSIRVNVNVDGATVEIDGTVEGAAPVDKVVTTGEHKVTVSSEGYIAYSETINVSVGMASEVNVTLASASDIPKRVNTPFIVTAALAGVGLATGVTGWALYGYYDRSADNYRDALNDFFIATSTSLEYWNYSETCADATVANDNEKYFCETESKRRDYKTNSKVGLGVGVAGTVVFAAAGTMAALLFAKPEWFFDVESEADVTLIPVATDGSMTLVLSGRF